MTLTEFKANLDGLHSDTFSQNFKRNPNIQEAEAGEFQASQGYTMRPCPI